MKVGIDLSSTNTGLVILSDDNKLIWRGNFRLWDGEYTHKVVPIFVANIIQQIYLRVTNKANNIYIGVELGDFKNANITNRFNMIFGAIYQELWNAQFHFPYNIQVYFAINLADVCYNALKERCPIKVFNSNEWQQHLGLKPNMERQFRKDTARQFTKSNCLEYTENWTEDECDAYCIAYFLEKLRDRTQMHQEVKAKKVQAKKNKVQELREKLRAYDKKKKLYEKLNHYKDLATVKKLTKSQQRALEKAENELKELE